jgi:hypothetical protein
MHAIETLPKMVTDDARDIEVRIRIGDRDVIEAITRKPEGVERQRFLDAALRIGVVSLGMASGQIDAGAVRDAGQQLLSEVRELLSTRATTMTEQMANSLAKYFDPQSGLVPQRLEALVCKDGELERVLRSHVATDESTLARTLAMHVGDHSPIFRLLSPDDANGLRAQVADALEAALKEQREAVLGQFSLDQKDSALSRLVAEIATHQGELRSDVKEQVQTVVKEFSLDQPNSALSRLVGRVESAQKVIADQFSMDNDASALNHLSRLLQTTSDQIGNNLTLDDESSALSRLKRELLSVVDTQTAKNDQFHNDVRTTLAVFAGQRDEAGRSTRHGGVFEDELGRAVAVQAQRQQDVYEATGSTTGTIRNRKVGDGVVTLGPESPAPGARIVLEAKEDKSYDLKQALAEIELARQNRDAQIGIFVFSKKCAPDDLQPFTRYGNDLVILWDADDAATDLYLTCAYSVARALAVRLQQRTEQSSEALAEIERAARAIGKQVEYLEEMRKSGETVRSHGGKIAERAERMRDELQKQIAEIDEQLAALTLDA